MRVRLQDGGGGGRRSERVVIREEWNDLEGERELLKLAVGGLEEDEVRFRKVAIG